MRQSEEALRMAVNAVNSGNSHPMDPIYRYFQD